MPLTCLRNTKFNNPSLASDSRILYLLVFFRVPEPIFFYVNSPQQSVSTTTSPKPQSSTNSFEQVKKKAKNLLKQIEKKSSKMSWANLSKCFWYRLPLLFQKCLLFLNLLQALYIQNLMEINIPKYRKNFLYYLCNICKESDIITWICGFLRQNLFGQHVY